MVTDKGEFLLNKGDTVVTENEGSGSGSYTINQGWGAANQRGLKLSVPVEKQKVGELRDIVMVISHGTITRRREEMKIPFA